jgi:hypothetical protein
VFRLNDLHFLQARAIRDGRLAVAISLNQEVFVGVLRLESMRINMKHDCWRSPYYSPPRSVSEVDIGTICERWVIISRDQYDEQTWHEHVPGEKAISPPLLSLPAPKAEAM